MEKKPDQEMNTHQAKYYINNSSIDNTLYK